MFLVCTDIIAQNLIAEYESIPDLFAGYEKPINIAIMKFEGCDDFEQLVYDEMRNDSDILEKFSIYPYTTLEQNKSILGVKAIEPSAKVLKKLFDVLNIKFVIVGTGSDNNNFTMRILRAKDSREVYSDHYKSSSNSTTLKDVIKLITANKKTFYEAKSKEEVFTNPKENSGFDIQWGGNGTRKIYSYIIPDYPEGVKKEIDIRLKFIIKPDGTVGKIFLLSKADTRLENAAINSLWQWRFEPLTANQVQVDQTAVIIFPYRTNIKNYINNDIDEAIYFVAVEEMPEPIGGIAAIQRLIEYPEIAKRAGVEGKVYVLAFINENGNVTNAKIIKGIGAGCDEAALDAILKSKFKPGRQRGKTVKVQVSIPLVFKLQ
jgi:TonB family protein